MTSSLASVYRGSPVRPQSAVRPSKLFAFDPNSADLEKHNSDPYDVLLKLEAHLVAGGLAGLLLGLTGAC